MNPGISISIHLWRGIGADTQGDLFVCRYRLGYLTLAVERQDPLRAYRSIRQIAETTLEALNRRVRREMEGR